MQLHINDVDRTNKAVLESLSRPKFEEFLLKMEVQTNNNTKVKLEEEIKEEVEEEVEESTPKGNGEIYKLFRPINFWG